ncbi:MAG TPA: hypothetical protein VJK07_00020, partial [Candidatus Nanoarchaeia archaeon]|nr:hypothetical protein [Candidatus Nanoarchaeia archaeon]
MVHKKYTYKDGKRYGPYYYKTERVNGEIITTYLGSSAGGKHKRNFLLPAAVACVFVLAIFAVLFLAYYSSLTGNVALDVQGKYSPGEKLRGSFTLVLEEGELIPATSTISARLGGIEKTLSLHELLSASNIVSLEGDFYAQGSSFAGSGTGYGIEGTRIIYPELTFEIELVEELPADISDSVVSSDSSDAKPTSTNLSEGETDVDNNTDLPVETAEPSIEGETGGDAGLEIPESPESAIPEEEILNQEETVSEEGSVNAGDAVGSGGSSDSAETSGSESGEANVGITGGVISEIDSILIGRVSKGASFEYELPEGYDVRVVAGSVRGAEGETLDDNAVDVSIENGRATVSTEYKKEIYGFGEEFLGDSRYSISIPLSLFELVVANETTLSLEAAFDGSTFISESAELILVSNVSELSDENLTALLELKNETLANETFVNQTNQTFAFFGEIPSVYLDENLTATINLSVYFTGALSYSLSAVDIEASSDSDIMTLRANSSFEGVRMVRIIVEGYDGERL